SQSPARQPSPRNRESNPYPVPGLHADSNAADGVLGADAPALAVAPSSEPPTSSPTPRIPRVESPVLGEIMGQSGQPTEPRPSHPPPDKQHYDDRGDKPRNHR